MDDPTIFNYWLRKWDFELTNKGKKVLLTVDNCPNHKMACVFFTSTNIVFTKKSEGHRPTYRLGNNKNIQNTF